MTRTVLTGVVFSWLVILSSGCDQPNPSTITSASVDVTASPISDTTLMNSKTTGPLDTAPPPTTATIPSPAQSSTAAQAPTAAQSSSPFSRANGRIVKIWFNAQTGEFGSFQLDSMKDAVGCFENYGEMGPKNNKGLGTIALYALSNKLPVEVEYDPKDQYHCISSIVVTRP